MSDSNDDEFRRKGLRPSPDDAFVVSVVKEMWDLEITKLKKLESYDDCNYFIKTTGREGETGSYLVKFYNGVESENMDILMGLGGLCNTLHANCGSITVPHPIQSKNNLDIESITDCLMANGERSSIATRLFSWVEGNTLSAHGSTLELLTEVGRAVGTATNALIGFDHPAFHRYHLWDLQQFQHVHPFVSSIDDAATRQRVEQVSEQFCRVVLPDAALFPTSVLIGDCNDANVIVTETEMGTHVSGLIDFGDSCHSWTVNDIAIAIAYGIITKYGEEHPVLTFASMVAGYCSQRKLLPIEMKHLLTLVAVRLAASTSMGAYSISQDPSNQYLKLHALPAMQGLQTLLALDAAKMLTLVHLINSNSEQVELCPEVMSAVLSMGGGGLREYFSTPAAAVSGVKRDREAGTVKEEEEEASLPTLTFVTGNAKKLEEVRALLGPSLRGYRLVSQKVDLPELQGDPETVSAEKCKLAAMQVTGAVLVEDTSLCFNALGGLPGVYIKWFLESMGLAGLPNLLAAYTDKAAYAQCIFSLHMNDNSSSSSSSSSSSAEPLVFVGRCHGTIVQPRGDPVFGWDAVFQPEGNGKTFAEMSPGEKNTISHRYKAICALREHLLSEESKQKE